MGSKFHLYLIHLYLISLLVSHASAQSNRICVKQNVTLTNNPGLDSLSKTFEADIISLRDSIENAFKTRCDTVQDCVYHTCSDTSISRECRSDFLTQTCSCFSPRGTLLNSHHFTAELANNYAVSSADDPKIKEIVRTLKAVEPAFDAIGTNPNKSNYKWIYFGSSQGVFISYPGKSNCARKYDNRFRPWYIGAATGAKNFVLILDFSGSMEADNKGVLLKKAVTLLLSNLVISDWIGVVLFKSTATYYSPCLVRATKENINKIITYINSQNFSGGTNFSVAFETAAEVLSNTIYDNIGPNPCKTFVLFFTDGTPTAGLDTKEAVLSKIQSLPSLNDATVFSYALGNLANLEITSAISCLRNGVFEWIQDVENLGTRLNSYFEILSLGLEINKPTWTEPYLDGSGLGEMATCSMPVYDRSVKPLRLLGVVGIDVLMNEFYKITINKQEITNFLVSKSSAACVSSSISPCQMNTVRKTNYTCPNITNDCNQVTTYPPTCPNTLTNVFCNQWRPFNYTQIADCCGNDSVPCTIAKYDPNRSSFLQIKAVAYILYILILLSI